jgi:hypothetical protein
VVPLTPENRSTNPVDASIDLDGGWWGKVTCETERFSKNISAGSLIIIFSLPVAVSCQSNDKQ